MLILDSVRLIDELVAENMMTLVYFGNDTWGVCKDIKSKVLTLLEEYPEIKIIDVDVEKSHNVAVHYNIFTVPGILLYVDGKESVREARHISVLDLESKINRYYEMLFA